MRESKECLECGGIYFRAEGLSAAHWEARKYCTANVIQFTDYLFLAQWEPDSAILQAPFLLNKMEDWYKLAKSDWMKAYETRLQKYNIRVLSNNITNDGNRVCELVAQLRAAMEVPTQQGDPDS